MVVVIKQQKKSMNADTKALLSQVAVYLNEYVQTVDETLKKTKAFKDIDNILNAVARALLNPIATLGVPPDLGLNVAFSFGPTPVGSLGASGPSMAPATPTAFVPEETFTTVEDAFIDEAAFIDDSDLLPLGNTTATVNLPAPLQKPLQTPMQTPMQPLPQKKEKKMLPRPRQRYIEEDDGAYSDTAGYLTEEPEGGGGGEPQGGELPFPHEITFSAAAKPGDHPLFIDSRDIQEIITHLQTLYAWTPRKRTHQSNIRACLKHVRRLNVSWGPTNGSQVQRVHETLTTACGRLDKWVQSMIQKAPKVKRNDKAFKAEAKFFNNLVQDYRSMIQSDLEKYSTTKKRKRTDAPVAAVAQEGAEGKKTNDTLSLQFLDFQNSQVTPPSSPLA